jgi:hypothetical protein
MKTYSLYRKSKIRRSDRVRVAIASGINIDHHFSGPSQREMSASYVVELTS